jgi:hypothetical protein
LDCESNDRINAHFLHLGLETHNSQKVADFGLARNMGNEKHETSGHRVSAASTLSSQATHMTSNVCFFELRTVTNL